MEKDSGNIRDRLLARLPETGNSAAYRDELTSTLAKNEKTYKFQKWMTAGIWFYAVAFVTIPMTFNWLRLNTEKGANYEFCAFVLMLYASVELLKMVINRSRIDLLKEIKQVQLQVLELQASLENRKQ